MAPIFLLALSLLVATTRGSITQTKDLVLDTDDNPLKAGDQYPVLSAIGNKGGGLGMSMVNGTCPPHVIQHISEAKKGLTVMFFQKAPWDGGIVRISRRFYVLFPIPTECSESTLWKVGNDGPYVTTGGSVCTADPHRSRFSIVKADEYGYVIQYCPCWFCRLPRSHLAVHYVTDQRPLGVNLVEHPLKVVFQKVKED